MRRSPETPACLPWTYCTIKLTANLRLPLQETLKQRQEKAPLPPKALQEIIKQLEQLLLLDKASLSTLGKPNFLKQYQTLYARGEIYAGCLQGNYPEQLRKIRERCDRTLHQIETTPPIAPGSETKTRSESASISTGALTPVLSQTASQPSASPLATTPLPPAPPLASTEAEREMARKLKEQEEIIRKLREESEAQKKAQEAFLKEQAAELAKKQAQLLEERKKKN